MMGLAIAGPQGGAAAASGWTPAAPCCPQLLQEGDTPRPRAGGPVPPITDPSPSLKGDELQPRLTYTATPISFERKDYTSVLHVRGASQLAGQGHWSPGPRASGSALGSVCDYRPPGSRETVPPGSCTVFMESLGVQGCSPGSPGPLYEPSDRC